MVDIAHSLFSLPGVSTLLLLAFFLVSLPTGIRTKSVINFFFFLFSTTGFPSTKSPVCIICVLLIVSFDSSTVESGY